jgi:hypothetical protein
MVFLINALDTSGTVTLRRESVSAAMKKAAELIADGCWDVEIVTPDGGTYNSSEFDRLAERVSGRPALSAAVDAQHLS